MVGHGSPHLPFVGVIMSKQTAEGSDEVAQRQALVHQYRGAGLNRVIPHPIDVGSATQYGYAHANSTQSAHELDGCRSLLNEFNVEKGQVGPPGDDVLEVARCSGNTGSGKETALHQRRHEHLGHQEIVGQHQNSRPVGPPFGAEVPQCFHRPARHGQSSSAGNRTLDHRCGANCPGGGVSRESSTSEKNSWSWCPARAPSRDPMSRLCHRSIPPASHRRPECPPIWPRTRRTLAQTPSADLTHRSPGRRDLGVEGRPTVGQSRFGKQLSGSQLRWLCLTSQPDGIGHGLPRRYLSGNAA